MTRTEAHTLICAAQSGNTAARDELIEYYCASLVPALAVAWHRLGFDDACSIGNLAVVESVDSAIVSYDVSLSAGIAAYVRQAIVRALSHADYQALVVHAPSRPGKRIDDTPRARLSLSLMPEAYDPDPNPEDLAIRSDTRQQLTEAINGMLSPEAARIMAYLYVHDMDAKATAQMVGSTAAHVDYIRSTALKVLRSNPEIRSLLGPTATT